MDHTTMAETSLQSYHGSGQKRDTQERRVELEIRRAAQYGRTREELAERMEGIKESSVCGRVKALIDKGLVFEHGTRLTKSNKNADVVIHKDYIHLVKGNAA